MANTTWQEEKSGLNVPDALQALDARKAHDLTHHEPTDTANALSGPTTGSLLQERSHIHTLMATIQGAQQFGMQPDSVDERAQASLVDIGFRAVHFEQGLSVAVGNGQGLGSQQRAFGREIDGLTWWVESIRYQPLSGVTSLALVRCNKESAFWGARGTTEGAVARSAGQVEVWEVSVLDAKTLGYDAANMLYSVLVTTVDGALLRISYNAYLADHSHKARQPVSYQDFCYSWTVAPHKHRTRWNKWVNSGRIGPLFCRMSALQSASPFGFTHWVGELAGHIATRRAKQGVDACSAVHLEFSRQSALRKFLTNALEMHDAFGLPPSHVDRLVGLNFTWGPSRKHIRTLLGTKGAWP